MRIIFFVAVLLCAANEAPAADFTVTITDPAELAGITYARGLYNAANPGAPLATDGAYVSWVMRQAAKDYGRAKAVAPLDSARKKCVDAGDCADADKITAAPK